MNSSSQLILLIDPDVSFVGSMQLLLEKEGLNVKTALDGKSGVEMAKNEIPKLIIVEVFLPDMDGIEICCILKSLEQFYKTFIIFYTKLNNDYTEMAAFAAGADDYISKNTTPRLLIIRIQSLLKRAHNFNSVKTKTFKNIILDREKFVVYKDGVELYFVRKEFELLELLFSAPRKVFSRKEISKAIWGTTILKSRTLDVHIRKIREKLGEHHIKTLKGIGYSLEA